MRDVAHQNFVRQVPQRRHEMEDIMMNLEELAQKSLPSLSDDTEVMFKHLLEVYIDDFIGLIQANNEADLRRFSRCILHAI